MSLDDLAIEYRAELPTAQEFERLFRSSGWTEALEVAAIGWRRRCPTPGTASVHAVVARSWAPVVQPVRCKGLLAGRPAGTVPSAGATSQATPAERPQVLRNASRSALSWSLCVYARPCGAPA